MDNTAERAIEKHPIFVRRSLRKQSNLHEQRQLIPLDLFRLLFINFSHFHRIPFSNLLGTEKGRSLNAPLWLVIVPFPLARDPCHTALANLLREVDAIANSNRR